MYVLDQNSRTWTSSARDSVSHHINVAIQVYKLLRLRNLHSLMEITTAYDHSHSIFKNNWIVKCGKTNTALESTTAVSDKKVRNLIQIFERHTAGW